jgi:hypothetical protein
MNETAKTLKKTTVSLPRDIWYGLRVAALRDGATTSVVVTRALVAAFAKREPSEAEPKEGRQS